MTFISVKCTNTAQWPTHTTTMLRMWNASSKWTVWTQRHGVGGSRTQLKASVLLSERNHHECYVLSIDTHQMVTGSVAMLIWLFRTFYWNKSLLYLWFQRADQYILKVKGQDLNGGFGGHSATSTVTINVEDVNDNHPTLEKKQVLFCLSCFKISLCEYVHQVSGEMVPIRGFRVE